MLIAAFSVPVVAVEESPQSEYLVDKTVSETISITPSGMTGDDFWYLTDSGLRVGMEHGHFATDDLGYGFRRPDNSAYEHLAVAWYGEGFTVGYGGGSTIAYSYEDSPYYSGWTGVAYTNNVFPDREEYVWSGNVGDLKVTQTAIVYKAEHDVALRIEIKNNGSTTISDARYKRIVDWDIDRVTSNYWDYFTLPDGAEFQVATGRTLHLGDVYHQAAVVVPGGGCSKPATLHDQYGWEDMYWSTTVTQPDYNCTLIDGNALFQWNFSLAPDEEYDIVLFYLVDNATNCTDTANIKADYDELFRKICRLTKTLDPEEGGLGTVVNVTIDNVMVGAGENVTVVDTLPSEFTYINGTFEVNGTSKTPIVEKRNISYTIEDPGDYTIEFDIKVTEAYWEDRNVCNEVAVYNETDVLIDNTTACFNITAFTDLYKELEEGPESPVIGVLAEWKIGMGVTNNFGYNMTGTKITDRFGGDLKIDSINTTAGNYTFKYTDYTKKRATVNISRDGVLLEPDASLDKDGVTIGTEPYEFHIFWTGKAHKAHFAWTIGDLADGDSADITIGVSTDKNPKGHQEYTEIGDHELNSGATLKFIDDTGMQLSAVTAPIVVEAVEPVVP